MIFWARTIFLSLALGVPSPSWGTPLKLAFVFQDSMVLQRDVPLPIWGTATPGAAVSITLAGQHQSTSADAVGNWKVTLNAMPATSQPCELTVTAGDTIQLNDVLIGEVWIAAGQSNMEFPLSRELHAATELPNSNSSAIRLLNMPFGGQYVFSKRFDSPTLKRLTPEAFYAGTWNHCTPASAKPFSAIGYYFAKRLQEQTGVPIGIINMAVGGSPTQAWIARAAMSGDPQLSALTQGNWLTTKPVNDWCKQRAIENLGTSFDSTDPSGPNHAFKPGFLFLAGPTRILPFPIRGVIWYQGESNSLDERSMLQHETLFKALVRDWRQSWGIGDFPFLYCQLSGIGTAAYKSQYWPEFRDQQRRLLAEIPNTAMAVTSDYGNQTDVHPKEKRVIGERLCAAAMALAYGSKQEWEGPLVDTVGREGPKLIVAFTHTTGGLCTSDGLPIRGFEIAGSDGQYFAADAVPEAGSIQLTAPQVSTPVSARYDWQPYPDGNLINGSQFPCSTFAAHIAQANAQ